MNYNVDPDRVISAIKRRGVDLKDAAEEMGYSYSALTNLKKRKTISKPLLVALERTFGITYEMIKPEETTKAETERSVKRPDEIVIAPRFSEEQWKRLGDLIKQSILEAFKEYI